MSTVSTFGRDDMVRRYFRLEPGFGSSVWVALTHDVPAANSSGTALNEPDGSGYVRMEIPLGADHWDLDGYGGVTNADDVVFPAPTADWGLIAGWALCTADVDGETLAVGEVVFPQQVVFGQAPTVGAGAISYGLQD